MPQGHRPDRVGEQIREMLSDLLSRGAVHDPGIGFITLTRVHVTPDLQQARVFYSSLGDAEARKKTAKALERATPFMRRHIGSNIRLRRVPELEFRFDESVEHQDRIERILHELHEQDAIRAAESAPAHPDPVAASDADATASPDVPHDDTDDHT
jgi:ribosome-binding factor A